MRKKRLRDPGVLDFQIDPEPLAECLTEFGGLSVVSEAYRAFGVRDAVVRELHVRERKSGMAEAEVVESPLLLFAAGGDRLEDLAQLRQDQVLAATAGFELATPDVALNFPYCFHDPKLVEARPQNTLAFVPSPSEPLQQLEIRFAVSAPMSAALKQACEQKPKDKWKRYVRPGGEVRACDADIE